MLALEKMQLWRRTVLAVDVFALLVAAVLAALAAGHGQISTADARLAAIDMSFVLLAMRRARSPREPVARVSDRRLH